MAHSVEGPGATRIPIIRLGWTLSTFLAISFVLCVVFGFIVPDLRNLMPPSFFPGFSWEQPLITALPWLIGSLAAGWYVALLFGILYNAFGRVVRGT
jgi:hypothetical protein